MKTEYLRPGFPFALAHAVEEAGEFLAAAGKTQRWGRSSSNPELPVDEQESNESWLRREMGDLRGALDRLETAMVEGPAQPQLALTDVDDTRRRARSSGKVKSVKDMPYYGTLPSGIAFIAPILNGGDETQISGKALLDEEESVRIFNRDPQQWKLAARFGDQLNGSGLTPSAAIAFYIIAHKLDDSAAERFVAELREQKDKPGTFLASVSSINGCGRRIEQLRELLIAFRSFAGLPRSRPIFPFLTRRK